MRRRDFIAVAAGAALAPAVSPRTAAAQQPLRRIGMLMNLAEDDAEAKRRIEAFLKALGELGWSEDKNIHIDYRWGVEPSASRKMPLS